MARDRRLFFKSFNSGLLDRGHLTIRQREIVIDRVTASCGAEYEWGVHVSVYAAKAGLTEAQIASLVGGGPDDDVWTQLTAHHSDEAILELLMLAGTSPVPGVGHPGQRHAERHAEICRGTVIDWRPYELILRAPA
jgi:Carboxymuconolactone decarboxylase family